MRSLVCLLVLGIFAAASSTSVPRCGGKFPISNGGNCYYVSTVARPYHQAEADCNNRGGHLASILSPTENSFVKSQATKGNLWFGITDSTREKVFVWKDGKKVGYKNWNGGEPNNWGHRGEDCTEMYSSGKWNDLHCDNKRKYICKQGKCGAKFPLDYAGDCYYVGNLRKSYTKAQEDCTARGGHLASILNVNENAFVKDQAVRMNDHLWVGLTDTATEKKFVWKDGKKVSFTNWNRGEPNDLRGEDCTEMYRSGTWNDLKCTTPRKYICKKGAGQEGQGGGTKPVEPGAGNAGGCSTGYTLYGTTCYRVYKDKKNYADAEKKCNDDKANLLYLRDETEAKFYAGKVKEAGMFMWTGLNDIKKEGAFVWTNGLTSKYRNWGAGQPDNWHNNEDCVHLYHHGNTKLNDLNCKSALGFICSVDPFPLKKNGHSYYVSNELKTNAEAEQACVKRGGHLATIPNKEINAMLMTEGVLKFNRHLWFGYFDKTKEGTFVWNRGRKITYVNWHSGEPNDAGKKEDCTEMYRNGKWNDLNCAAKRGYMCEKDAGGNEGQSGGGDPKEPGINCPPGYTLGFKTKCYKMYKDRKTYADALKTCRDSGAFLLFIRDQNEANFFADKAKSGNMFFWMGLNDIAKEATGERAKNKVQGGPKFVWTSGSKGPKASFRYWAPNQPDNHNGNEDCVHLNNRHKQWNDLPCNQKHGFICSVGKNLWKKNKKGGQVTVKSVLACEHKTLTVKCDSGTSIQIRTAMYGRQEKGVCKGANDHKTSCSAKGATEKVKVKCNGKQSCAIGSSNGVFGDPCHGTFKYLQVKYSCIKGGQEGQTGGVKPKEPSTSRCGKTFTHNFGRNCYYVGGNAKNFKAAEADCVKNGAHLASIRSNAENDFVKGIAKGKAWIGYHDGPKEGHFRWLGYTNWNKHEPNNWGGREDCTEMYRSGLWNDLNCAVQRKYICEKEKVNGKCDKNFNIDGGQSCYYIAGRASNNGQKALCSDKGGYLARIDNAAENQFIKSKITENTWIGYNDKEREGSFFWGKLYTNWNNGEPNNVGKGGEDCTEMYASGKWNDLPCDRALKYICKK